MERLWSTSIIIDCAVTMKLKVAMALAQVEGAREPD